MCPHVCQCGNLQSTTTTSQPQSQKLHLSADHNDATDEWISSMRQAFTATCTTDQSNNNGFLHASTSIGTSYPSSSALQLENLDKAPSPYKSLENNASPLSAWLPQNETLDGLCGSSAFVDIDGSPIGMAIDLDMQASDAGLFLYGNDSPLTPMVERQDSLPTPGLDHSPSSVPAHDPSFSYAASAGMAMSAHAGSSAKHSECNEVAIMASEALSHAFDFTAFSQPPYHSANVLNTQSSASCACSTRLTQASTSIAPLPMPMQVAVPAPGGLDPELINSNSWTPPVATATATRFEPYQNRSIASTASSTSPSFFSLGSPALSAHGLSGAEPSGPRRRSLTVGSLPGMPSSSVDSVGMLGVSRPQTPGAQQASLPSSPRLGSTKKFSSVPCRRSRPSTPALSAMFAQDSVEMASLKERRMASHASRAKVSGSQRSPLAGLFAAQDLLLVGNEIGAGGSEPSPTVSELSLGLSTPTSLTFSPPYTPLGASFAGLKVAADADSEEVNAEGTVVKAKIALHHHRTKLQRNVLNEIVTSLQGAYKHCRRQCPEPSSLYDRTPATELNQLQLEEQDPLGLYSWMTTDKEPTWCTSGVVVAGETKEMRKNRQKAESKMRMRRKEIAQFAALTTYARLAHSHLAAASADAQEADVVGRSLAQVFMEHKEAWSTLIALEKRLFHTVRVQLGLQELVVRRLTEALSQLTSAS
ncbi:hypothetical protein NDA14_002252 [Ustilago hordei]|nr:hypothetical protein NDA14_007868 [Ustilago hordei]KAJ1603819.1 hypothetical protein NDA14_002252 [Ustilago hordei]